MKPSGSVYVGLVFAVLIGYFTYQAWFNPSRAVKRRLGEIAATLSVPEKETEFARIGRVAELRRYLADDIRVRAGASEVASRDAIVGAMAALRPPPGGLNVQFVDVQVTVDSATTARAYLTAEVNSRDVRTGESVVDAREAVVTLAKRNGEWVVASAETKDTLQRP